MAVAGVSVEESFSEPLGDSGAVVGDADVQLVVDESRGETHSTAPVLVGVAHEVREHLVEVSGLHPGRQSVSTVDLGSLAARKGCGGGAQVGLDQALFRVRHECVLVARGMGEDLVEDVAEAVGVSRHDIQAALGCGVVLGVELLGGHLGVADDGRERVAQLVAQHSHEVRLEGIRALQVFVGARQACRRLGPLAHGLVEHCTVGQDVDRQEQEHEPGAADPHSAEQATHEQHADLGEVEGLLPEFLAQEALVGGVVEPRPGSEEPGLDEEEGRCGGHHSDQTAAAITERPVRGFTEGGACHRACRHAAEDDEGTRTDPLPEHHLNASPPGVRVGRRNDEEQPRRGQHQGTREGPA